MPSETSHYDTIIIGGGVIGLYTAFHLSSRMDPRKILVVDRTFPSGGASGRNGGGVRQQWESKATIRLAKESVQTYSRFGRDFGFNPWFRQGGYLFLAFREEERKTLQKMERGVREEGLPIRWLDPAAVHALVEELEVPGILGGTYLPTDGVIHPFPVIWGLISELKRRGVELRYRTEVSGVEMVSGGVRGVRVQGELLRADRVVNAAGGWSQQINSLAGLPSFTKPTLHEILATEPVKPFLKPMVVTLGRGTYFSQTMRGEIVGGLTMDHSRSHRQGLYSSGEFLVEMARELARLMPRVADVRILRCWSGYYDDSPDGLPLLGEDPRLKGFYQANGFGGHGFMLAPSSTARLAKILLGEKTDLDPHWISPDRFTGQIPGLPVEGLSLG
jgi:sarcosine oxidase subunit beta